MHFSIWVILLNKFNFSLLLIQLHSSRNWINRYQCFRLMSSASSIFFFLKTNWKKSPPALIILKRTPISPVVTHGVARTKQKSNVAQKVIFTLTAKANSTFQKAYKPQKRVISVLTSELCTLTPIREDGTDERAESHSRSCTAVYDTSTVRTSRTGGMLICACLLSFACISWECAPLYRNSAPATQRHHLFLCQLLLYTVKILSHQCFMKVRSTWLQ